MVCFAVYLWVTLSKRLYTLWGASYKTPVPSSIKNGNMDDSYCETSLTAAVSCTDQEILYKRNITRSEKHK